LFTITQNTPQSAELMPKGGTAVNEIFSYLGAVEGLKVSEFHVEQAKLDDIFVQIYREEGKEAVYA
jgi:hypothetical protein